MAVKKICVLGLGMTGVPLSAVIAYKCPEIRVTVVKTNPDDIYKWNTGKYPQSIPGLEEFIRKCQNKNLVFTNNEVLAIKESEIIFIVSEAKLKTRGKEENQVVDLSALEDAAYLIAEHAESSKIVVENSSIPLKSAECLNNVFKHNSKPGVELQVLSNPEFYEHGSSLRTLLYPDCVLIGSENTSKGLAAAKKLASIYERWVCCENIIMRSNWSVELSKICTSAMAAQTLASIYAMCSICEESGGDIAPLLNVLTKDNQKQFLELSSNVGKFPTVLHNLVYMCDFIDLKESADYWRHVLNMLTSHHDRFLRKFVWNLPQSMNKKIALLGYAYFKDTKLSEGSSAVDLCSAFLEEEAFVSIYDPRITSEQVIEDMRSAGCAIPLEKLKKQVTVQDDPYRAAQMAQVVVLCGTWSEFSSLDYSRIFAEMMKPAYIFDRGQNLPLQELSEIGFQVYGVGKPMKNSF